MADNVVPFLPRRENDDSDMLWVCGECSCSTFYLRRDGAAECAACRNVSDGSYWLRDKDEADVLDDTPEGKPPVTRLTNVRTDAAARKRVVSMVGEKTFAVIVIQHDGTLSWWQSEALETPEQIEWFEGRMRQATQVVKDMK